MLPDRRIQAKRFTSEVTLNKEGSYNPQIDSKYIEIVLEYQSKKEKLAIKLFELTRLGKKFKLDSDSEIREVNPVRTIKTKES